MNSMQQGDYYVWYCEWCDSRNLTPWTRLDSGKARCGACHNPLAIHPHVGIRLGSCLL